MMQRLKNSSRYQRVMSYIADRLEEASTWRGLVLIMTVFGARMSQDEREAFVLLGLALVGLIGALFPDPKGRK